VASDWERTVHITLVPDKTKVSEEDVLSNASMILEDMRAMGHEGSKRRRQRQLRQGRDIWKVEVCPLVMPFQ